MIKQLFIWLLLSSFWLTNGIAAENKKLAQSGFQFLSVVSDARASGMAEAMTSLQVGSRALFFNPAGMANMQSKVDLTASTNQWIADIQHTTVSAALNVMNGKWGVFGFSLQTVDYGDFFGTVVDKNSKLGYRDTNVFNLNSIALGVGYAKQLTDRFSVGGQVRYVKQDLGETMVPVTKVTVTDSSIIGDLKEVSNELSPVAYDFGTQYKTGFKSLVFGMSVRNFSKEIKYVEEGFQLPLVFNLGISMDLMDFMEDVPFNQSLIMSIDASHYRSHPEQIKLGFDYQVMDKFALRSGYISNNDESAFSFGLGVSLLGAAFDYSYTPFGVFNSVQRMTVRFSL